FVATPGDCNDTVAAVHPGATEHCDGVDEDCNGTVDAPNPVGAPTFYVDADGDGHGDPNEPVRQCALSSGLSADDLDGDDTDASVHPGAAELCDGVDQDCDGVVDDNVVTETFYADLDGDGYGDPNTTQDDCAPPAGFVAASGDCDDGNALVSPGAVEI